MAVHLEAREDILSDRSINPTNLDIYIELAKSILGCYVADFLLFLGHKHNFKSLIWNYIEKGKTKTGWGKVTSFPHCVLFSYPQLSTWMQSSRFLSMLKRQPSPLSCNVEAKNASDCPNLFSNFSWGTGGAVSLPIYFEICGSGSISTLENIKWRIGATERNQTHQPLREHALAWMHPCISLSSGVLAFS